jgi:hypothetical protein
MTKINIYCLFETGDNFYGVYSSLKAAHRDALKICSSASARTLMEVGGEYLEASESNLRKLFQGETEVKVRYTAGQRTARIVKTKIRE